MTPKQLKEAEAEEADRRFVYDCIVEELNSVRPTDRMVMVCERAGVSVERAIELGYWEV